MDVVPLETILEQKETMSEKSYKDLSEDEKASDERSEDTGSEYCEKCSEDSSVDIKDVEMQRESGDGQESVPSKKLDDDEDKQNPQYIPKKGTFYEHDDRAADEEVEVAGDLPVENPEKEVKKKVWQEKKQKWTHDKFDDNEQAPKSKAELVSFYGYDIRNEDSAPKARRRRRYGRGPNKYTRTWEDEDAYNRRPLEQNNRRGQKATKVYFGTSSKRKDILEEHADPDRNTITSEPETKDVMKTESPPATEQFQNTTTIQSVTTASLTVAKNNNVNKLKTIPSDFVVKEHLPETFVDTSESHRSAKPQKEVTVSDYRGFTSKIRQFRNAKTDVKVPTQKFPQQHHQPDIRRNVTSVPLEDQMSHLNITYSKDAGGNNHHRQTVNSNRQDHVPPRMLATDQKVVPKRYSSLRQRTLPESSPPPQFNPPQPTFYPTEYAQQGHLNHQPSTQIQMTPQVPVTPNTMLASPQFAPPYGQPHPQFLQPPVPPPQFIPQQTPQIINYVPSQPQFPPGYQSYQQPFNGVNQPEGIFQTPPPPPPSGITYYSTDHQVGQRTVIPKRPKAAIPIVAPPTNQTKDQRANTTDEFQGSKEQVGENMNVALSYSHH